MKVELDIPGILAFPGDGQGWTDRAVTLAHVELGVYAEKLENFTGLFTRMLFQERRARLAAMVANSYLRQGWTVCLRGHSNGCDIIRRALFLIQGTVEAAQFIAPAVEAGFERNGLNELLRANKLQRLVICWSPNDRTLQWARGSQFFLGLFGNSYGALGLTGARRVAAEVQHRVEEHCRADFNHNDWVSPANLLSTMRLLHLPKSGAPRLSAFNNAKLITD